MRRIRPLMAAVITLALVTVPTLTFAETTGGAGTGDMPMPGAFLWNWIRSNILGAFPIVLACVSLYMLVRRAFAAFISFAVFAMLVAVFVYAPEVVQAFGVKIGTGLLSH